MKKQFLLCAAFLLATNLQAQENEPVVIVSTTGKVALISAGKSKARPVQAGAAAKKTGQLKLAKDAKATLYCNGQFKEVSGGQTIALSSICAAGAVARKMDADADFGEKLMAAVDMVDVAKQRGDGWVKSIDPKKSGDGWGNSVDPKKSGDGWGGKGSSIWLIMPFGMVTASTTTFSWSKPATSDPYQLLIQDVSGNTIHSVTVTDTFATIDLKGLNLASGEIYRWKVSVAGSKPMDSNELKFGIGTEQDLAMVMKNANRSSFAGGSQNPALGTLAEAVALEKGEWYYAAQQSYARLAQNSPDSLVRMMHAAFWMRYGYRRLAAKAGGG